MTMVEELAAFVVRASYEDLSAEARQQLKVRVLDSLACALGALEGEPIAYVRAQLDDFGGNPRCTLIGGGRTAPDRAAFYNGALVRYLDFNDTYLAPGETCHPSDNLGAVLAAAEYAGRSGRDLMVALAVAYQVQGRLSAPGRTRAGGRALAARASHAGPAGVAAPLGLDQVRTAPAIAVSGTAFNVVRVPRTGARSHWKGLAYPNTAFGATHAAFLAMRGITGPLGVFEGNKGFMDAIAGRFYVDWSRENLELVTRTILKKYNAEVHSQSAVEAVEELMAEHRFAPEDVEAVEIEIFDVAYHIIGGGEEGDKTVVRTKEEADHSLPYIVAVMILDGQVMPEQYRPERILREDVQTLLRKVKVRPRDDFSRRFPAEMPCRVVIRLRDGRVLEKEKADYEGFHTRPMSWAALVGKFERLAAPYADPDLRREIIAAVENLDGIRVSDLTALLARAGRKT